MSTKPVARTPRTAGRQAILRRRLLPILVGSCFGTALANPFGAQVVNGQASFLNQGNVLSVTNTPGTIINWQSFSINPGELTRFIQQNANSAVLNRITGQDPSQILGALQSNGRVFLVNPNGILFGQGAQVDVNGLVASTLNISNEDFLNGKLLFKAGDKAGNLKNEGAITTPTGGQIFLVAPNVENSGIITSPKGDVMLAAGHTVQLVDTLNPDLRVVLSAPEHEALNLGQVIASGGRTGIYGALVKQRGVVSADSAVVGENGKVVLKASRDTLLEAGSRTSAKGAGKGGEIQVLGERVGLFGDAKIDVSGDTAGGIALIGGDYQGKNAEIANAKQTVVGKDVEIRADAVASGDGGKVIVWSDETTRFHGSISARGGQQAGDGGFVETSGKFLDMQGRVDTRAPRGATGTLLLDPTNIYIASSQANATAAGMSGTDLSINTSGPTSFVASGAVADSLLTTSVLQTALGTADVTVSTTNASGIGAGNISVVDPITWGNANSLTLNAAGAIAINGAVTASSGTLRMDSASGNITQSAAIQVDKLLANANGGAVLLTNGSNNVGTLSAYGNGGVSFSDSNGLTVGAVLGSNGVRTNNNGISITVGTGDLDIANSVYGIDAGTSTATLVATTGSVLESSSGKITAGNLSVTAGTSIALNTATNAVAILNITQTDSAGGGISFVNNVPLSVASVSHQSLATSAVSIETTGANNLTLTGQIAAGSSLASLSLKAGTTGSLLQSGSGLATANTITLQSNSSGSIGTSGSAMFKTSSIGGSGNASITVGSTSGPSSVYLMHTGDATLNSVTLGANAPVDMTATGNLTAATINTGTSGLNLGAGGLLTVPAAKSLSGTGITLTADRMALNAAGTTNAGTGTLHLLPKTSGWNIDLGASATDAAANTLELSTGELNTLAGTGILKIGDLAAGNVHVSAAIAPAFAGDLLIESGGNVTQVVAGTITKDDLAIAAIGDIKLNTAPNLVTNLAGHSGGTNKNFLFKNGAAPLNVGSSIAGKTGIALTISGSYSSASPDGVIALESSGAITQSPGATLGGKAVYTKGTKVTLDEANPTGVIAGQATGAADTDTFSYTSSNGIFVASIPAFSGFGGASGIQHAGAFNATSPGIVLSAGGSGTSQEAPITSSNLAGLKLVTTGPINLGQTTNSVGRLTAMNTGKIMFTNGTDLALGVVGGDALTGLTTTGNQAIEIEVNGALTVADSVNAGTGFISLQADALSLDAPVTAGLASIVTFSPNRPITVGSTTCDGGGTSCLRVTKLYNVNAQVIGIGEDLNASDPENVPSGAIFVEGISVGGSTDIDRHASTHTIGLLSGAGITQNGPVNVTNLGISAGGTVTLTGNNVITNISGKTTAGAFSFKNTQGFNVTTLSGGTPPDDYSFTGITTNNGNVSLTLAGASTDELHIPSQVDAGTGTVTLTSSGSIYGSGTSPDVKGGVLNITASGTSSRIGAGAIDGDGGLQTSFARIASITAPNGSVDMLNFTNVIVGPAVADAGTVVNVGGAAMISTSSGSLTVNGDIVATGDIALTAGFAESPSPSDVLTINGNVASSSGLIILSAHSVGGTSVPTTSNVTLHVYGGASEVPSTPALPTVDQCIADPTLSGCTSVLPALETCTVTPTLAGCTAVLPSMSTCITAPATAGCSAVLPTVDACMANPSQTGCTAVLPSLSTCASAPSTLGCSVVLPTLATCTTSPTTAGCSAVLPSMDICVAAPATAGCTVILPAFDTCIAVPTTTGCTAVLPTVASCTTDPTQPGCSTVLPTLTSCTANPAQLGCTVVLPALSTCTTAPTTAGCSAVLPTVDTCTTNPTQTGCSVVLPTLSSCTTNPNQAGCTVVLPSISACMGAPTLPGCTAVLPTLTECSATPNKEGCSVVVPTASKCITNPSALECQTVLPVTETGSSPTPTNIVTQTVILTTNTVVLTTARASSNPVQSGGGSSSGGTVNRPAEQTSEKSDDKKEEKKTTSSTDDSGAKKNEPAKKMYCN